MSFTSRATSRVASASVIAALALSSTVLGAPGAAAAGRDFGTVLSLSSARLEACKVPIQDGTKYRVFGRLDNSRSAPRDEVLGKITVLKDGRRTEQRFDTGYIRGGRISDVDSVIIARKPGFKLEVVVSGRNAGSGGVIGVGAIRRC